MKLQSLSGTIRRAPLIAVVGLLMLVLACGGQGATDDVVSVSMKELNQSGQQGTATLTARGADTEIVVTLSAGPMKSGAIHIHSGQCGDNLGGVENPLTTFSGESSTTVLAGVSLSSLLNGDRAINAHNAEDASVYTACANLPTR